MRTILLPIGLAVALLILPSTHAADAQAPGGGEPVAIGDYSYADLYRGWRASMLLGKPVIGADGERLGTVGDLRVGFPGELDWLVVEPAEATGADVRRFAVRWDNVEPADDLSSVTIPLTGRSFTETAPSAEYGPLEQPADSPSDWSFANLLDGRLELDGDVPVGPVDDVLFDEQGVALGVVFRAEQTGDLHAVPWRAVVVEPGGRILTVPLTADRIGQLETFDYAKMAEGMAPS